MQSVEVEEALADGDLSLNAPVDPATCAAHAPHSLEPANVAPPRELELKFSTDKAGLALALASPLLSLSGPDAPSRSLVSVYFDTPSQDLKKHGMILRVRRAGRSGPVMTLKWSPAETEGVFSRGEIEVRTRGLTPDLSQFDEAVAARIKAVIENRPLGAQFETRIKRRIRLLSVAASQIEVAFDEGVIVSGERSWPVTEIELEHKSGAAADLYELGARIATALPAKLDVTSKSARAFALAADEAPKAVKPGSLVLPQTARLDDAVAAVLANTLKHFVANWAALREGGDPESIHQMRVALRRLRSALSMFKRALPCAEFEEFRAEAKRIASALGPARDCDVFRELVEDGPMAHFGADANFAALLQALGQQRDGAYDEARVVIDAPRTAVFVVRMQAFLARRGWRNAVAGPDLPRLTESARIFAASALERLHKRVAKRGKTLLLLPDEERHEVRIVLKNLRYAAEFFGVLFGDGRAVHAYIRAAARLQDLLGAHNDAASAQVFARAAVDAETARAAGIVIGWYGRGGAIADAGLKDAWSGCKKARRFWR